MGKHVSATKSQEVTEVIKVDGITSQGLVAVFKKNKLGNTFSFVCSLSQLLNSAFVGKKRSKIMHKRWASKHLSAEMFLGRDLA